MNFNFQLPQFEGPLALLLYLIRKEEMDIMDIPIHNITTQYLEYIKQMKEFDLELAGDFIAMAATLLQIKSKMLLPHYGENGEILDIEDPRKELVQRLLEYQKYQDAGKALYERPLLGRDMWARGVREKLEMKEEDILLEDNALFSLIAAFRLAMRSAKRKVHQVTGKLQSIASRIMEFREKLVIGKKIPMSDLITSLDNRRKQVLITFLSLLELGKIGFVSLFQTETYQEIYVEAQKAIEIDVLSRVEEYDHIDFMNDKLFSNVTENVVDMVETENPRETISLREDVDSDEELGIEGQPYSMSEDSASDEEIESAELELNLLDLQEVT